MATLAELFNERYSTDEFVYGLEPNLFFKEQLAKLTPGKLFLPGEGEGRNGVYAAKSGWEVDCLDFSEVAKNKAIEFAKKNNVTLNYNVGDLLAGFALPENHYDAIATVFVHIHTDFREEYHNILKKALKPGGTIIMQLYDHDQLPLGTGGPKSIDELYDLRSITEDFIEFDFVILEKVFVTLQEGTLHNGKSSVINFVAKKV